jgi:ATP-dependent Lhr-like helicase
MRFDDHENLPVIAYCTPEYVFGDSGILKNKRSNLSKHMGLLVIDECHKALDRRTGFRDAYSQLADYLAEREVAVLACSATLTKTWLAALNSKYFEGGAKCLLTSIKRQDVRLSLKSYTPEKSKDAQWKPVVDDLVSLVNDNITIIFVDYQNDAETISQELNVKGVGSRFMIGGRMTVEEKRVASRAFNDGVDNVLVATETYECGMHNPNVSQVIRIGSPRNLAVMVQEMGGTVRNSNAGEMIVLSNEFHSRCNNYTSIR